MKNVIRPALLPALLFLVGCYAQMGPVATKSGFPEGASGAQVSLQLYTDKRYTYRKYLGELIAVLEDGAVVAVPRQGVAVLTFTPWSEVRRLSVQGNLRYRVTGGPDRGPDPEALAGLRPLSRFPQGLSGDVLDRLLENHGQQALESLGDWSAN